MSPIHRVRTFSLTNLLTLIVINDLPHVLVYWVLLLIRLSELRQRETVESMCWLAGLVCLLSDLKQVGIPTTFTFFIER